MTFERTQIKYSESSSREEKKQSLQAEIDRLYKESERALKYALGLEWCGAREEAKKYRQESKELSRRARALRSKLRKMK